MNNQAITTNGTKNKIQANTNPANNIETSKTPTKPPLKRGKKMKRKAY